MRGLHYVQDAAPHVPPIPMHVMVHPLKPMDARGAFEFVQAVLGKKVQEVGELRLD